MKVGRHVASPCIYIHTHEKRTGRTIRHGETPAVRDSWRQIIEELPLRRVASEARAVAPKRRASLSGFVRFMQWTFVAEKGRNSCLFWRRYAIARSGSDYITKLCGFSQNC